MNVTHLDAYRPDREDGLDYQPCSREDGLRWARFLAERYSAGARNLEGLCDVAGGRCADCDRDALVRFVVGRFHCCRACARRRRRFREVA